MASQNYLISINIEGSDLVSSRDLLGITNGQGTVAKSGAWVRERYGRFIEGCATGTSGQLIMQLDTAGANDQIDDTGTYSTTGEALWCLIVADSVYDGVIREIAGWQSNGPASPQSLSRGQMIANARNLIEAAGVSFPATIEIAVGNDPTDKFSADVGL